MGAIHVAAAAGGFAAGRRGRRLSPAREAELDREFAEGGIHCFVCGRHMTRWVQVGSGWASSFYVRCLNCDDAGLKDAHNTCVPLGFRDGLLGAIAWRLDKNIQVIEGRRTFLVDQCECCQGTDTLWILNRIWYNVVRALQEKELSPEQVDIALEHPHWAVRKACVENQSLTEVQLAKALCDDHSGIREAAEERIAAQVGS